MLIYKILSEMFEPISNPFCEYQLLLIHYSRKCSRRQVGKDVRNSMIFQITFQKLLYNMYVKLDFEGLEK